MLTAGRKRVRVPILCNGKQTRLGRISMETKTKIAGGAGSQNVSARWPDYAFTMLICFSSWQDQIACGELWSYFSKDPRSFRGLDQLLFAIENAVDEAGRPAAWQQPRQVFERQNPVVAQAPGPYYEPQALAGKRGAYYTASVRVYYRQHASIQGELTLSEPPRKIRFRSALELLHLLWSALAGASC